MSSLLGFLLYCGFIYVVDWFEYNVIELYLAVTGNLEE